MSNKINKQLKKGSPLFDLGQGLSDLLDFESIGRASNPNRSSTSDLMGRGLIHLGSIFSQMEDEFEPEVAREAVKTVNEFTTPAASEDKIPPYVVKKGITPPAEKTIEQKEITTVPTEDVPDKQTAMKVDLTGNVENVFTETVSGSSIGKWDPNKNQFQGTGAGNTNFGFEQMQGDGSGFLTASADSFEYGRNIGAIEGPRTEEQARRVKGSAGKRLKDGFSDDNPVKRLALEQPETFEQFKGLMYKRKHKDESPLRRIAHIYNSPFTRTDQTPDMEGVDYRYMQRATMPEYAKQGFGSAAAEGFNLAIDRSNYKKAVEEDYNKELADEMGELQVPYDASAGSTFNQNRLELIGDVKTRYANDKALYTKGEISWAELQSNLGEYTQEVKTFKAAQDALSALRAEFMENKGTHDMGASKPEMADFYNTLEQNPDSFTTKTISGVPHLVGKTLKGKDVKVPVSKVASGEAGFKLVPKTSTSVFVDAGVKAAQGFTKEQATRYGIGVGNVKKEDIRPQMEEYFFSVIGDDETKLRGLASNAGLDYDAYEALINQPDGNVNYQLLKNDIVKDMMLDFESQYFPKEKTTMVDPAKTGIGSTSQARSGKPTEGMRKSSQAAQAVADLPELNEETKAQYLGYLPPKLKKDGYTIAKNKKTGQFLILRLDPKTKKLSYAEPFSKEAYQQLLGAEPGFKL